MEKLIGRKSEWEELSRAMESSRSEFVILYGRRRIGKTFLVRSFFQDRFDFYYTGAHRMPTSFQLHSFQRELIRYSRNADIPAFSNWMEAFEQLEDYLESLAPNQRKVLFLS